MSLIEGEQANYNDIITALEDCGGVSRIRMWQLRVANGNDRLGVNVVADIARQLRRRNIGCIPTLTNQKHWDEVRIYLRRSSIGQLIEAIHSMTDEADETLQAAASCTETMDRIKELIAA